jgi:pimeloyl-ACP methyl ester carboxylesterase
MMDDKIVFEFISTNGIRLHTAFAGPEAGELVILLHGFPEAWFGWEKQICSLAEAGFRVIAPDQRGYNLSDKPKGVTNYQMESLVEDVIGLADALGVEQFYLAGHDFGAMVAWNLAMRYPGRLKRMVIANVPHPVVMGAYLSKQISQLLKSWYAFFFQIPKLPERLVQVKNWKMLLSAMPEYLSEEERDRYRSAWGQPGAITGMINWYRATLRKLRGTSVSPNIHVPTLIVWGQQDPHISYEMASLSLDFCEDGRLVTFENATHWVLQDKHEEVSQLMLEHFHTQSE